MNALEKLIIQIKTAINLENKSAQYCKRMLSVLADQWSEIKSKI